MLRTRTTPLMRRVPFSACGEPFACQELSSCLNARFKDSMDYKERIKRLLSLAESPNEHEAKAALLKARELMAEHKLTHSDIIGSGKRDVKDIITAWTCSKRRDPWMVQLAATVGEHYCCKSYISRSTGMQTNKIGFIGFKDDIGICMEIFDYAAKFVTARTKDIKKEWKGFGADTIRSESDSYGFGFIKGLNDAYDEQLNQRETANDEWGLVLNIPAEVHKASNHLKRTKFRSRTQNSICRNNYIDGYNAGKQFNPEQMIKAAESDSVMLEGDSIKHKIAVRISNHK